MTGKELNILLTKQITEFLEKNVIVATPDIVCIHRQDLTIQRIPIFKIPRDGTYEQWIQNDMLVCYEDIKDQFYLKVLFMNTTLVARMGSVEGFFQS